MNDFKHQTFDNLFCHNTFFFTMCTVSSYKYTLSNNVNIINLTIFVIKHFYNVYSIVIKTHTVLQFLVSIYIDTLDTM